MTDDWRKFPKRPPGYAGLGGGAARQLGEGGLAWSRKKAIDGAVAVRKGNYLYIEPPAPPTGDSAVLWMTLGAGVDGVNPQYLRLPTSAGKRTVRRPAQSLVGSPTAGPPGPNNLYVGDGWVLRVDRLSSNWPAESASEGFYYSASLVRAHIARKVPAAVLSEQQEEGTVADVVLFSDVLKKDDEFPRMYFQDVGSGAFTFASGYDESINAYRFGVFGFYAHFPLPFGSASHGRFRCFVGDTKTRRLQEVDFPGSDHLFSIYPTALRSLARSINVISPAPGVLFALQTAYELDGSGTIEVAVRPAQDKALRSTDYGRTWALTDLPELDVTGESPSLPRQAQSVMEQKYAVSAIGGGRIALACPAMNERDHGSFRTSKVVAEVFTLIEDQVNYPGGGWGETTYEEASDGWHRCWGFFISDANGANFSRKPWPLDTGRTPFVEARRSLITHRWFGTLDGPRPIDPTPTVDFTEADASTVPTPCSAYPGAVGSSMLSAGAGSFFIVVMDVPANWYELTHSARALLLATLPMRVLWTTDYGGTWAYSEPLPLSMRPRMDNYPDFTPTDSLPAVNFTVVRPYVDEESPGLLAAVVVQVGASTRVWLTDARFSHFTDAEVVTDLSGYRLGRQDRSAHQNAVYVGPSGKRAPMRPGYPEFDRPPP